MKKLLLLLAALLAFKGAKGATRSPVATAPSRLSLASLWPILLAPRWLRLPLLLRAVIGGGRRPTSRR
jgi:hypothetical protein